MSFADEKYDVDGPDQEELDAELDVSSMTKLPADEVRELSDTDQPKKRIEAWPHKRKTDKPKAEEKSP